MKLSVIIPTHNRPAMLGRCLRTLTAQEVDPSALEVVVVDDGSTTEIGPIVSQAAAAGPIPMRCVRQELSGLNLARNRGAAAAQGAALAFLDDDTLVCPGWAGALLGAFQDPACAGVGGKVDLDLSRPLADWLAARSYYLARYDLGPDARWLTVGPGRGGDPLPVGANCAVRRSDFHRLGGFRAGLDRIGGSLVSNGDTDFFQRLLALGGRLRYEPRARVVHCVPPERLTARYFARRHFAQGISDELLWVGDGKPAWMHRLGLARMVARAGARLGRDLLRGDGPGAGLFDIVYWGGRYAGQRRRSRADGRHPARP